jgi:hypothetical protein
MFFTQNVMALYGTSMSVLPFTPMCTVFTTQIFHGTQELSTASTLASNCIQIGQNVCVEWTEFHLSSTVFTGPVVMKIALAPELFVRKSASFQENPTYFDG